MKTNRLIPIKILLLAGLGLFLFLFSAGIGEISISPIEVGKTLIGQGDSFQELILYQFRLPRVVMAFMVGVALAFSATILQSLLRNPLASPDYIGITGGASVVAVSIITFFSDSTNALQVPMSIVPVGAFIGASVVGILMYLFSWKKGGITPFRFILVGIGFYTLCQALVNLIILLGPVFRSVQAKTWLTGSIYGTSWSYIQTLLPWLLVLIPITFLMARRLQLHELGEEVAIGLGSRVQRERLWLLLLSTGLAGAAVSFVGGIGFVGLIAPHMARRIVGNSKVPLLLTAGLLGGVLVMGADLLGRTVLSPREIPAGVFTALLGAPYFLYLLVKAKKR